MATKRGGNKRPYKTKGRQQAGKAYQDFIREKYKSGLVPNAAGVWVGVSSLPTKIAQVYQALFGRLA